MPSRLQKLRLAPGLVALGPRGARRAATWLGEWSARDPADPHSHFGPFAVDAHLQRQGIGSALLGEYCKRLDSASRLGYLETDRPENVPLYERFGFKVVD